MNIFMNIIWAEWEDPQYLIVLAEEELIAIDLTKTDWPSFAPPYLASPHASAITCSCCVENISEQVWNQIQEAGSSKLKSKLVSVLMIARISNNKNINLINNCF